MRLIKEQWRELIAAVLSDLAGVAGASAGAADGARKGEAAQKSSHQADEFLSGLVAETPPSRELGDIGFPMFSYGKSLRRSPALIAQSVAAALSQNPRAEELGSATAQGPYVNIFLSKRAVSDAVLAVANDPDFGRLRELSGQRIMVEFSSPNTNKPLHLGHLRNDVLGESLSRILDACGAEIRKVCIINDRGVHICKSMLAYSRFGEGRTPESEAVKSDHFVGDWYVRFHAWSKEDPAAEAEAQALLRRWEGGDPETLALWKRLNAWAVDGIKATYKRTGVSFDKYYHESDTYLRGKEEILKGLERGVFEREEDGSVWADLTADGLDRKVLLRKDGTALYITQDIGTALYRYDDWPFDRLVFVVGSEQQYHFRVLFKLLEKLGFSWASALHHLSYGMVYLPEGKMKSREGTVVDADDLIDELKELALGEIDAKERTELVGDAAGVAEKVAIGALHYFLLRTSPVKDMLFNPKDSLSFNGDTGPYLQYMGARISSMLRKKAGSAAEKGAVNPALLDSDAEWELVKTVASYPEALSEAARKLDPSIMASYLYSLSKAFSRFYHDCPILNAENPDVAATRLALSEAALSALRATMHLACVPFLETM